MDEKSYAILEKYLEAYKNTFRFDWKRDSFDFSVMDENWKRFSVSDFKGSSHDKITREVWKRA